MLDWQPSRPPWPDPEAAEADRQRRTASALDLWGQSEPAGPESAVGVYLWSRLLLVDPVPPSLRLYRGMRHRESGTRWPAMLALVEHAERGAVGVHATYLHPDGSGRAAIEPGRRTLGPVKGGAVRLGEATPDLPLLLGEGIETCLAAQIATGWPAWSAMGASFLPAVVLPADIRRIVILADHDPAGARGVAMAAMRFQGRDVRIARPPRFGSDWNDVLRGRVPGVRHVAR